MKKVHWISVISLLLLAAGVSYWQLSGKGSASAAQHAELLERDARAQRLRDRDDIGYWLEDYTTSGEYTRPRMRGEFSKIIERPLLRNPRDFFEMIDAQDGIPAKREILPDNGYFETRLEARMAIFDYIEGFYNTRRRHSSLGNLSPIEFLQTQSKLESAA